MQDYSVFVAWVYGLSALILIGYLVYLYRGLRRERALEDHRS
ncbi:cbb3-type cytochrome oxidase subunit 3 [Deinobacterium chartae]|uniref:Cbb3-type cytochrome oxidase subunit 3 n=1 Tax=Deinobacterium chartae TaxID=521158 RepID=A0A841HZS4_9DEIO|nr:hypothetical protein [Deinobacterium chartae]MBB6098184.1 cbb3-type cytochrome oxidase subunit 3 [Deinobacterium chartae]